MTQTQVLLLAALISAGLLLAAWVTKALMPAAPPDGQAELDLARADTFALRRAEFRAQVLPEFHKAAAQGRMEVALILALFRLRPDTEPLFLDAGTKARSAGATYLEATEAGAEAIRPILLEETGKAMLRATDQQAADAAEVTLQSYYEYEQTDAQACARVLMGLAPRIDSDRWSQLRNTESAITLDIMNMPAPGAVTITPPDEVQQWIVEVLQDAPEAASGATYIGTPDPTDEQAMAACKAMITIYEALVKLPLPIRAAHVRGMSAG
tara:strand:- start:667 stop:1470 length:804 start_codon:yes stop_codon:yes gene_type:complete